MRSIINFLAIILILIGLGTLVYNGFTYTQREKVAEIGNVEVTANTQKTVYISPVVSGLTLVVGIMLLLIGRKGSKP